MWQVRLRLCRLGSKVCVPRVQAPAPATPEMEEEKPAPKPKDPLAALPPSPMVLDSWKRLYSNTPAPRFKEVCVAGLWAGADIPNSPTNEVLSAPAACMHACQLGASCPCKTAAGWGCAHKR